MLGGTIPAAVCDIGGGPAWPFLSPLQNTRPEYRYPAMRDALNATGRPIFFSMCEWGVDNPGRWAPSVGNSWRTTPDISVSASRSHGCCGCPLLPLSCMFCRQDEWAFMISRADLNEPLYPFAGPGAWNDPDILVRPAVLGSPRYCLYMACRRLGMAA